MDKEIGNSRQNVETKSFVSTYSERGEGATERQARAGLHRTEIGGFRKLTDR